MIFDERSFDILNKFLNKAHEKPEFMNSDDGLKIMLSDKRILIRYLDDDNFTFDFSQKRNDDDGYDGLSMYNIVYDFNNNSIDRISRYRDDEEQETLESLDKLLKKNKVSIYEFYLKMIYETNKLCY